jgi:hypothetical protein
MISTDEIARQVRALRDCQTGPNFTVSFDLVVDWRGQSKESCNLTEIIAPLSSFHVNSLILIGEHPLHFSKVGNSSFCIIMVHSETFINFNHLTDL